MKDSELFFYIVHHGHKEDRAFDPVHKDELGSRQLHAIKNMVTPMAVKYIIGEESQLMPFKGPVSIISGIGKRFREVATRLKTEFELLPKKWDIFTKLPESSEIAKRLEEFKIVPVILDSFLGGHESVYIDEQSGKIKVALGKEENGDVEIYDREQCYFFDDSPAISASAWPHMAEIHGKIGGSKIISSGRRLLIMLGLKPEEIEGGALFRITDLDKKEVVRVMGY